jgi:hypothetical protein
MPGLVRLPALGRKLRRAPDPVLPSPGGAGAPPWTCRSIPSPCQGAGERAPVGCGPRVHRILRASVYTAPGLTGLCRRQRKRAKGKSQDLTLGGSQTSGLGRGRITRQHTLLAGRCPESRATACRDGKSWLAQLRPARRVLGRSCGSHLPSSGHAGDAPLPAPAVIVPRQTPPGTRPNGGLLPASPPVAPRWLALCPCRAQSFDARLPRLQPACGWISYPYPHPLVEIKPIAPAQRLSWLGVIQADLQLPVRSAQKRLGRDTSDARQANQATNHAPCLRSFLKDDCRNQQHE